MIPDRYIGKIGALCFLGFLFRISCSFKLLMQHGSSFWFWSYVFIGEWHGWSKSGCKCNHVWTFFCTCTRWTFPGKLQERISSFPSVAVQMLGFIKSSRASCECRNCNTMGSLILVLLNIFY